MIRVEVARHFNEDAFSFGLAQGMADRLRDALREVGCAEHEEDTHVLVSTDGVAQVMNDLHVEVRGCCAPVAQRIQEAIAELRENEGGAPQE